MLFRSIREFAAAGGTGFTLVTLPYKEVIIDSGKDFAESFEITYRMASLVKKHTDLKLNVAVGPYPILLPGLAEKYGLETATEIMIEGMEIAGKGVAEGKSQALGEIGRPHFPVSEDIWDASNHILQTGMTIAKENSCPVIIHSEAGTTETNRSLSEIARKAGLEPSKVIKHSSPPFVTDEDRKSVV